MKKVWFILFGLLLLLPLSYSLKIVHTYDLNNLEFNGKYNFSYTPYGISYYDGKWYIITIIPPKIFEIDSNFTKVINKWNAPCDFPLGIRRYNGKWYIVGGNIGYWNPTRVYECDDNFNCNSVANIDSIEPDAYDIFHYNDRWYLIGNKRIVYEFYNNWT
ncbi:MAG: hypothetical protein J7L43_02880, partial [Candidatus Aenigmarchaeota archaeon]|nr:hypothetical protein [Candidatus Aenigmarchaeota archaeon]